MSDDIGGVWRTVGGRKIFIKDGEDLQSAMKKSGKFKKKKSLKDIKKEDIKNVKDLHKAADELGMLPSELQDELGIKDSDLGLKDDYTEKFEKDVQSVQRYIKAEEAKNSVGKGPSVKEDKEWNDFCESMERKGFLKIDNMSSLSDNDFVDKIGMKELGMFNKLENYSYKEIQDMVRKQLKKKK